MPKREAAFFCPVGSLLVLLSTGCKPAADTPPEDEAGVGEKRRPVVSGVLARLVADRTVCAEGELPGLAVVIENNSDRRIHFERGGGKVPVFRHATLWDYDARMKDVDQERRNPGPHPASPFGPLDEGIPPGGNLRLEVVDRETVKLVLSKRGLRRLVVLTSFYTSPEERWSLTSNVLEIEITAKGGTGAPAVSADKVVLPASSVRFLLVPPDDERRSGLYTLRYLAGGERHYPSEFRAAADGKADPLLAGEQRVTLVGKLPGTVIEFDHFDPRGGSIEGRSIRIPVRYVKFAGEIPRIPAPRDVYVVARTPVLKPAKYSAQITFEDWEYRDLRDKTRILRDAAAPPPSFAPLVCDFEVTAKGAAGPAPAKEDTGKAPASVVERGLSVAVRPAKKVFGPKEPLAFDVTFTNVAEKRFLLFDVEFYPWWRYEFTVVGGADPGRRWEGRCMAKFRRTPPEPIAMRPGESRVVKAAVDDRFMYGRPGRGHMDWSKHLPAGKYRLSIESELTEFVDWTRLRGHHKPAAAGRKWPFPFWTGTIKTRPVEFEIAKGAAP